MTTVVEAETYGESVRRRRRALLLTQQELADAAHICRVAVTLIEAGHRNPGLTTRRALENALAALSGSGFVEAIRSALDHLHVGDVADAVAVLDAALCEHTKAAS